MTTTIFLLFNLICFIEYRLLKIREGFSPIMSQPLMERRATLIHNEIPVISLKSVTSSGNDVDSGNWREVAHQIDQALSTFTCFFIVDHGIEDELGRKVLQDLTKFFEKPIEQKLIYELKNKNEGRGYVPLFTLNANLYMGRKNWPNDAIERFLFGNPETRFSDYKQAHDDYTEGWAPNVYDPCFRSSVVDIYGAMERVALVTMQAMSLALGEKAQFLESMCSRASHTMKANYYPTVEKKLEKQNRLSEHIDVTPITLIIQDGQEGLIVRDVRGRWHSGKSPYQSAILVMVGQCMEKITNGHWPGTLHAVPLPVDQKPVQPRISMPFFIHMNNEAPLIAVEKYASGAAVMVEDVCTFWELQQMRMQRMVSAMTECSAVMHQKA